MGWGIVSGIALGSKWVTAFEYKVLGSWYLVVGFDRGNALVSKWVAAFWVRGIRYKVSGSWYLDDGFD